MINLDLHSFGFNRETEQIVFHSLSKQIFRGFLINDMSQIDMTVLSLAEVRKRRKNRGERGGRQVVCIVCGIVLFNQLNDHLCCYMFARVDKLEEPLTKTPQKRLSRLVHELETSTKSSWYHHTEYSVNSFSSSHLCQLSSLSTVSWFKGLCKGSFQM